MADIAARREARRKRILENSNNRIGLITGRPVDDLENESTTTLTSIPTVNEENGVHNIIHPDPDYPTIDETIFHRPSTVAGNGFTHGPSHGNNLNVNRDIFTNLLNNLNEPKAEERETMVEKIISFKLDIVLLAFVIQVLHAWNTDFMVQRSFSIFLPLFVMNITKMFVMPAKRKSGLTNLLLMLNGVSPAKVQKIILLAQIAKTFMEDAFIYLFIIVSSQSLWGLWCNGDKEKHII